MFSLSESEQKEWKMIVISIIVTVCILLLFIFPLRQMVGELFEWVWKPALFDHTKKSFLFKLFESGRVSGHTGLEGIAYVLHMLIQGFALLCLGVLFWFCYKIQWPLLHTRYGKWIVLAEFILLVQTTLILASPPIRDSYWNNCFNIYNISGEISRFEYDKILECEMKRLNGSFRFPDNRSGMNESFFFPPLYHYGAEVPMLDAKKEADLFLPLLSNPSVSTTYPIPLSPVTYRLYQRTKESRYIEVHMRVRDTILANPKRFCDTSFSCLRDPPLYNSAGYCAELFGDSCKAYLEGKIAAPIPVQY